MGELQKIAIGLLGMSHPEIDRLRSQSAEQPPSMTEQPARKPANSKPTSGARVLSSLKFAVAALLAGARAIPLGDNGRVTRELGEYGAHLKGC
jgi:hypothetical protein